MCESRFYFCEKCGNLAGMIHSNGVPMYCCGKEMTHLEPNTSDASREKHVPEVKVNNGAVTVNVGSVAHPMQHDHSINWVYLQTDRGGHRKCLEVNDAPVVSFVLDHEKPLAAYAYCNLHGLSKTDI